MLQIVDKVFTRNCSTMSIYFLNSFFRYRSNNWSVPSINVTLVNVLIFFASTPVFVLKCKFCEVSLIKIDQFFFLALNMIKFLNKIFTLEVKLLLSIWRQIFFLPNFFFILFYFGDKDIEGKWLQFIYQETSYEIVFSSF